MGRWWWTGMALLLALVLRPGPAASLDLNVDTSLHNSPYTVSGSITYDNENVGTVSTGVMNQPGFTNTVNNNLSLGSVTGASGSYNLSGTGSLWVSADEYTGYSGTGTFTQDGGSHTVSNYLSLGDQTGSSGTYNLNNGELHTSYTTIGYSGTGTFSQSGGNHVIESSFSLGGNTGSRGTYNLSGGTLSLSVTGGGASIIGDSGSGTFTQTGGSHDTLNLVLGANTGSSGTYELTGGGLGVLNNTIIGQSGRGTFTQTGGDHTMVGDLILGNSTGSSGTYILSGGTLLMGGDGAIGFNGSGIFTQSGGTHTVTGSLYLGYNAGASGTYNLNGGNEVTGNLYLGYNAGASGAYNLDGGNLRIVGGPVATGNVYIGYSGSGTFTQSGGSNAVTGNLILAANAGSRGTYNLSGGSLRVFGTESLGANSTFNHTGGTNTVGTLDLSGGGTYNLRGTGVFAALMVMGNLTNSGTVKPGNSVGNMTVNGNYTQTAAGTLVVEVASPTSYDKLNVTGTASLAGALTPTLLGGYQPQNNQGLSGVVTAAGGLTGNFANIANPISPTLFWQVRYQPTSVDLWVQRSYANSGLGLNANQQAVGNMLNSVANSTTGDLNNVLNNIDQLTSNSQVCNAVQQISADKIASLSSLGFAGSKLPWQGLSNRINSLRYGGLEGGGGFGGLGGFNIGYSRLNGLMLAYNSSSLAELITAERPKAPGTSWGVYLEPAGLLGSIQSSPNQTGFNYNSAGFNAGADYRVRDDLLVGLGTGYSHTGASFYNSGGSVAANTWPIMAYAAYLPQTFYAYGSLGYALNLFNLERNLVFGGINRTAKSSPTGNQFNAYGEAGYDLKTSRMIVTPVVSLAYSSLWVGGFTEGGAGSLDLKVSPQYADSLQTGVGAKLTVPMKVKSARLVPQIYAIYQHEFLDRTRGLDARLNQGSSTFGFQTDQIGHNFAVVGADVTLFTKKNGAIQLNYNAEVGRDRATAHLINAGLRWEF